MNKVIHTIAVLFCVLTFSACGSNKSHRGEPTMLGDRDSLIIDSMPPMDRPDEGRYDKIPPPPGNDGRNHPPLVRSPITCVALTLRLRMIWMTMV